MQEASRLAENRYDDILRQVYNEWVSFALSNLSKRIHPEDVDRLVLTRRHWAIQGLTIIDASVSVLIHTEIQERCEALRDAIGALGGLAQRWHGLEWLVVPDTNVFCMHKVKFDRLDWTAFPSQPSTSGRVVIPMVVIDELDKKKHGGSHVAYRAAFTAARLNRLFGESDPRTAAPLLISEEDEEGEQRPRVAVEIKFDDLGHLRLPRNDEEILAQAVWLRDLSDQEVTLVTFDTGMAFRARSLGLRVVHLDRAAMIQEELRPKPPKTKGAPQK